jgi:hypothetical protein
MKSLEQAGGVDVAAPVRSRGEVVSGSGFQRAAYFTYKPCPTVQKSKSSAFRDGFGGCMLPSMRRSNLTKEVSLHILAFLESLR